MLMKPNPDMDGGELLDQSLDLADKAIAAKAAADQRIAQLESELAQLRTTHERVLLEKVAAAKASPLDPVAMQRTLEHMQRINLISGDDAVKLAARIQDNPNFVFPLMVKIAEQLIPAPQEGAGFDAGAGDAEPGITHNDPDGWSAFLKYK